MLIIWGGIFAFALLVSLAATYLIKQASPGLGLLDHPGERKIHSAPMPLGGGLAIFIATIVPVLIGLCAAFYLRDHPVLSWIPETAYQDAPLAAAKLRVLCIILGGGSVIMIMGLIDDRRGLSPFVKLAIQSAVAILLCFSGIRITLFFESSLITTLITIIWIVGITNAFNMMDNMDGLCAGVALIVCFLFLAAAFFTGQLFVAALLLVLAGALAGFLIFNFPPASIFMGDTGSMFVGYMLAVSAVVFTFYQEGQPLFPVLLPLLVLAIPIYDVIVTVCIRIGNGYSPFKADKNHFSHRLVALGMTHREAVLTIYLCTLCIGVVAIILNQLNMIGLWVMLFQTFLILMIVMLLERAGKRRQ